MPIGSALDLGSNVLSMYMATEVGDAGRAGEGVSMHASRRVGTYTRVMGGRAVHAAQSLPAGSTTSTRRSCGIRSASAATCRSPRAAATRPRTTDAAAYFAACPGRSRTGCSRLAALAQIRDGADLTTVVNVRRSVYSATDQYGRRGPATYEGTTRRGLYYQLERARAYRTGAASPRNPRNFALSGPRLLPEQIYATATSGDEVIALLRQYGYLGWSI